MSNVENKILQFYINNISKYTTNFDAIYILFLKNKQFLYSQKDHPQRKKKKKISPSWLWSCVKMLRQKKDNVRQRNKFGNFQLALDDIKQNDGHTFSITNSISAKIQNPRRRIPIPEEISPYYKCDIVCARQRKYFHFLFCKNIVS